MLITPVIMVNGWIWSQTEIPANSVQMRGQESERLHTPQYDPTGVRLAS